MNAANFWSAIFRNKMIRSRYRLSLVFLVLLASFGIIWLGVNIQRAKRQNVAVAAIRQMGGDVEYDFEVDIPGSMQIPDEQPPQSTWLRKLFGIDFFANVVSADLCKAAGMGYLEQLHNLQVLRLYQHEITDAEMDQLNRLPQLRSLSLNSTLGTDVGLRHLKVLPQLQELALCSTPFTDAGLERLRGMIGFKMLVLDRTQITDKGVRKLQQALPNCEIHFSSACQNVKFW